MGETMEARRSAIISFCRDQESDVGSSMVIFVPLSSELLTTMAP